jgi:hypothetical protein
MDNIPQTNNFMPGQSMNGQNTGSIFNSNNTIIFILVLLLVFSFLGVNIFVIIGNFAQLLINLFGPLIAQILSIFGYASGTLLNTGADALATTTKTGIDIVDGTAHSIGGILQGASVDYVNPAAISSLNTALNTPVLDNTINNSGIRYNQPIPDSATNPIQKPITSGKVSWCLIGEYQGRKACASVTDPNMCQSGKMFDTQSQCMN